MTRQRDEAEPREGTTGGEFLTAKQAAELLGIRRATLYAYVSRGWIESVPGQGRRRLYAAADVDRLRARSDARSGHGPVAGGALRWGEPVIESEITAITDEGPRYRGRLVTSLVDAGTSYETVAELLWHDGAADLRAEPWTTGRLAVGLSRLEAGLPSGAEPLDALRLAVATLGVKEGRIGLAQAAEEQLARRLLARLAALCGLVYGPERPRGAAMRDGFATIVAHALGGPELAEDTGKVRLVEAALILSADHELNTSAFTARTVASTGADLHACISAAVCALSGPLHGGACRRVEGLLDEALAQSDPAQAIRQRFARGDAIPGFGHPFYPAGDPRAAALLRLASAQSTSRASVQVMRALAETMAEAGHPAPAMDFGLVAVAQALGLPRGAATALFALGRGAGWVAHVLEQRRQGFLLRPTARYIGRGADA